MDGWMNRWMNERGYTNGTVPSLKESLVCASQARPGRLYERFENLKIQAIIIQTAEIAAATITESPCLTSLPVPPED